LSKPEYLDTGKVAPEIYIKGTRNAYSLALDPVRRYVAWGDVGPDRLTGIEREEMNLRKTPGFEGWPYFVGQNTMFVGNKTVAAPTNTSKWNTGLGTLPPAKPAFRQHNQGTAPITGPIYLYDGALNSSVKLPPHFNRMWFLTDFGSSQVKVAKFNADTTKTDTAFNIFRNVSFEGPIDFRQGPDGALYMMTYGAGNFNANAKASIVKISYTGTCRPNTPRLEEPISIGQMRDDLHPRSKGLLVNLGANRLLQVPAGMIGLELFDISGKLVWSTGRLATGESFRLPAYVQFGALNYRWIPASN
jgi:hypothetical protein